MPTCPEPQRPAPELLVSQVSAGYDGNLVIRNLDVRTGRGEVSVILGPNGCGKSTFLKAVTGQIRAETGSVRIGDLDVTNRPSNELAALGIGYIPQENDVFPPLTVLENLTMGGYLLRKREVRTRIEEILSRFPVLARLCDNRAGSLSGGERKLLAMARVLMLQPRVLVLDEPTANLSPMATREVLVDHVRALADSGTAVLIVEQKALQALEISDWAYVLVAGSMHTQGPAVALASRGDIGQLFLGRADTAATGTT